MHQAIRQRFKLLDVPNDLKAVLSSLQFFFSKGTNLHNGDKKKKGRPILWERSVDKS
jgi:hypothetical protein